MRKLPTLLLFLISPLATSVVAAESPSLSPPSLPLYDDSSEDGIWAVGTTFKAHLTSASATYIPFFGTHAPRNFPLTLRLASITIGGEALAFDAHASVSRSGDTLSLERGAVLEHYAILRDAIEQRFTFRTLPTRGEIVVTIDVDTDLTARPTTDAFLFEHALGHVRFGAAVAFDAAGRSVSVESQWVDGRIQLRVPAAFVASAALPLVIDPLITTFAVDADADEDADPDVAFHTGTSAALVVYERTFSSIDHDVYGAKYLNEVFQGAVVIDASASNWRSPRVAANHTAQNWLCVAAVDESPFRIIRGRIVQVATLALNTPFTISGAETGDKHSPDVGGDPSFDSSTLNNYCVVWQRDTGTTDTDVHGRIVYGNGSLPAAVLLLANSALLLDSRPSVSKTCGRPPSADRDWMVVFERQFMPGDQDVHAVRVEWNGVIVSSTFPVASTALDEREPTASEALDEHGAPRHWMAVYKYGTALRMRAIQGTSVIATHDLIPSQTFITYGSPDVTTDGRLWHVAYTSRIVFLPIVDTDVLAMSLALVGSALFVAEEPVIVAGSSSFDETHPRIACPGGTSTPYRTHIAYRSESTSNLSDVHVGVYDSPINASDSGYCFGTVASCPCGNAGDSASGCENSSATGGARLAVTGQLFVSADTAVLTATQLPSTAPALFFQGTSASSGGAPFGDGLLCAGGTITRMAVKFAVSGVATFPASGDGALHALSGVGSGGGWRYYQVWHRDSVAFCTSANFNLSNGVAAGWIP